MLKMGKMMKYKMPQNTPKKSAPKTICVYKHSVRLGESLACALEKSALTAPLGAFFGALRDALSCRKTSGRGIRGIYIFIIL